MRFSLDEFENALPRHFQTGYPLFTNLGLIKNQYIFDIPVYGTSTSIIIKSTILEDKLSAKSDKQAIKFNCPDVKIIGLPCRIQRTKHWAKRLNLYIKYSYIFILRHYTKPQIQINRLTQKLKNQLIKIEEYNNTGKLIGMTKNHAKHFIPNR